MGTQLALRSTKMRAGRAATPNTRVVFDDQLTAELIPNKDLRGWISVVGNDAYISFVESKRKGAFRELVEHLWAKGYTVKVPVPLARMTHILIKQGFTPTIENGGVAGEIDVWVKAPPQYEALSSLAD